MKKILPLLLMLFACSPAENLVFSGTGAIHIWGENAEMAVSGSSIAQQRGFFGQNIHIFAPGNKNGMPSLTAIAPPYVGEAVVGRALDVPLLAMPYLSWQWEVESPPRSFGPARIIIGFRVKGNFSGLTKDGIYPKYDRILEIPWVPPFDQWDNTLDLSKEYAKNWPHDVLTQVNVCFFAFWVNNQATDYSATLAAPVLFR